MQRKTLLITSPLIILFIFLLTSFKPIGSGPSYLKCKSESGRTVFNAIIDDIDGTLENAELVVDGVKLQFNEDDKSYVIFDAAYGVYTIYLQTDPKVTDFTKQKFLQFLAIPKTFNVVRDKDNNQIYEFKGKIRATEPRKNKGLTTPDIELNCTLEYHI